MQYEVFNPNPIPTSAYTDGTIWNYTLGDYTPSIKVYYKGEWVALPTSQVGLQFIVSTLVTSGKNAQGMLVGEQIGRNQDKFDNYVVPFLYAHEWYRLIDMIPMNRNVLFKYYDVESNKVITRSLYPSDRTATIYAYRKEFLPGEDVLRPEIFSNCSINFIDRGIL